MKPLDQTSLHRFNGMIADRIGLNVRGKNHEWLGRMLAARIAGAKCRDSEGYFALLESGSRAGGQEWRELIASLTTGESYFFRDSGHFYLLRHVILPELIQANGANRTLRVWSAGCATGEEPYSVAMLIDRFFPSLRDWGLSIQGTDIHEGYLEKARQGIYTDWSFRKIDDELRRQYFTRGEAGWQIDERIKRMVTFRQENLIAGGACPGNAGAERIDLILCRNVFIYFDQETVSKIISRCIPVLSEGGFLITGHGELYGSEFRGLQRMIYPEAVIYRRNSQGSGEASQLPPKSGAAVAPTDPVEFSPQPKPPFPEAAARRNRKAARRPDGGAAGTGRGMIGRGAEGPGGWMAEARLLADRGDLERAADACRRAVAIGPFSAEPYFLLSQLAEARGDDEEAKRCLKKVIYLEPQGVAAYLEIGALYQKEGDFSRAAKMRETARQLLRLLPSGANVRPYDGTAAELLNYVEWLLGLQDDAALPAVRKGAAQR